MSAGGRGEGGERISEVNYDGWSSARRGSTVGTQKKSFAFAFFSFIVSSLSGFEAQQTEN